MNHQNKLQFTLPQIGSTQMSRDDQGALLVNQATAAIVCSYLEHAAKIYELEIQRGDTTPSSSYAFRQTDLISLINSVQGALKEF